MKKDAYYFPHFANARNDNKIVKLRRVLGMEGYGIYFALLEVLRETTDFKIPIASLEDLAYEWHVSREIMESVVSSKFDLFKIHDDNFFSPKFNEYLQPYLLGKENKRIAGIKGNLVRHNHITKEQSHNLTDEQILEIDEKRKQSKGKGLPMREVTETTSIPNASQKKGKEKKGKEKKVNEIKVNKEEAYAPYSFLFISESFNETYLSFLEMRKEKKNIPTLRAEGMILKKLSGFSENGKNIEIAIESLENSIIAKYPNVYLPKVDFQKKNYSENSQESNFSKVKKVHDSVIELINNNPTQTAERIDHFAPEE